MNHKRWLRFAVALTVLVLAYVIWAMAGRAHPMAVLKVVDGAGRPVAGARVEIEGLRAKPGPYHSGWYGWESKGRALLTDAQGRARVAYPMYVFEAVETGTLCLRVEHPDFVPNRSERQVAATPPAGAPWRERT